MRIRRTWFVRAGVAVGLSLAIGACALFRSGGTEVLSKPSYDRIGEDARWTRRCYANDGFWKSRCNGYPPTDIPYAGSSDPELVEWLRNGVGWDPAVSRARRPAQGGGTTPEWAVQSVANAHRFKFAAHNDAGAFVIARIVADPEGAKDTRYGIGDLPATMDDTFYVVVRGYDDSNVSEPPNGDVEGASRKISRWSIYGIDNSGPVPQAVRVGNEGDIRWCGHPHPTNKEKMPVAKFQYCKLTARMSAQSDTVAARLSDPPLWFTCGLGCCTADFAF